MNGWSIDVLYPSYEFTTSTTIIKSDRILISDGLNKKLHEAHPAPNPNSSMSTCYKSFPRTNCLMGYSLDEAILLYRKLFYSTFEIEPTTCDVDSLLDHIGKWTLNSTPVIIDDGGAFQTKHLHLIQYAFPQAIIYSIDTLYEELNLLVCNIDQDETKWCFIPVFPGTGKFNQSELIECIRKELEGSLSLWNGIEITEVKFFSIINHLQIYDPYSEILGLKQLNFIDTIEKCEMIPCSVFMAYNSFSDDTPSIIWLKSKGLIHRIDTKIEMGYTRCGCCRPLSKPGEVTITTSSNDNIWVDARTNLNHLNSILTEKIQIASLPYMRLEKWLGNYMISEMLDGKLSEKLKDYDFHDPLENLFWIADRFFPSVNCLNISSFIARNGIEALTSSNIQQLIEEHVDGFLINDNIDVYKYPRNFVKECLQEILGPITNIHIHIDSYEALFYSYQTVRQLKHEDPYLQIEFSLAENINDKPYQPAIVLMFECNQTYVLVYAELNPFLEYLTKCTSLADIQTTVESSVAFAYPLSHGQRVKWHQNLSFVYVVAQQYSTIKQTQDRLVALGLQDINFISKKFDYFNFDQPLTCYTNQAIICFELHSDPYRDHENLPTNSNLLNQWIYNKDTSKSTGPIVTLYPNISNYTIYRYAAVSMRTTVGSVYNLVYDNVSVLFQWRNP